MVVVGVGHKRLGPSPHGEGGLKWCLAHDNDRTIMSLPARGGWIEMRSLFSFSLTMLSLPARGGWIEISFTLTGIHWKTVPPRTGRVD